MSNQDDPLVIYNGHVMRMSQAKALQQQAIQNYETQMTVTIESLSSLSSTLSGTAGEVWNARWQLDADMAGILDAIGTDDAGNKVRDSWNKNYGPLLAGFDQLASNVDSLGTSVSQAGDKLYQAECDNLKGFNVTPADPRPKPAQGRPNRAF